MPPRSCAHPGRGLSVIPGLPTLQRWVWTWGYLAGHPPALVQMPCCTQGVRMVLLPLLSPSPLLPCGSPSIQPFWGLRVFAVWLVCRRADEVKMRSMKSHRRPSYQSQTRARDSGQKWFPVDPPCRSLGVGAMSRPPLELQKPGWGGLAGAEDTGAGRVSKDRGMVSRWPGEQGTSGSPEVTLWASGGKRAAAISLTENPPLRTRCLNTRLHNVWLIVQPFRGILWARLRGMEGWWMEVSAGMEDGADGVS